MPKTAPGTHRPREIKLPVDLLLDHRYSDLAVVTYGLVDVLSGARQGPSEASRDWMAARLGCSVSGLAKALRQLSHERISDDPGVPDHPRYLVTEQRGCRRSARRDVVRGIRRISVPEASLGNPDDPDATAPTYAAWRLYAAYLYWRCPERDTVAYSRAEIAGMLRIRAATVTELTRELVARGLVVTRSRGGGETVVAPLLDLSDAGRQAALDALTAAVGPAVEAPGSAVDEVVDEAVDEVGTCASAGTAPVPLRVQHLCLCGYSTCASAGTALERDPFYRDPDYVDPPRVARAAATRRGLGGKPPAVSVAAAARAGVATWCRSCVSPYNRVELDSETGRPSSRPCVTCAPGVAA
jgi:hypothetical protein